ncbi:MAG TPA: restriction endonuclease subunit R [Microbacterium sp.]|nr:restriction endonuclease subunit R [Microbacterium sp.]
MQTIPSDWTLTASAFNWTEEVIRADRPAPDVVVNIARTVCSTIELEPGQLWRTFPASSAEDVDSFSAALAEVGGKVSIVGVSLDDWVDASSRRSNDERLAFLLPQLRAARRVGAEGVRLPLGQAGSSLLTRLLPELHDLDLTLYEEAQGQQSPTSSDFASAYGAIAELDDLRVRLLIDTSMLMPALPQSFLAEVSAGGVPRDFVKRLSEDWLAPATHRAAVAYLRSGEVPPAIETLCRNLLFRFGRSDPADLRSVMHLVGGIHLKFWDLEDDDRRVSKPMRDIGRELARANFSGTICSEWGGHAWLTADPTTMTRAHLVLAQDALIAGLGMP